MARRPRVGKAHAQSAPTLTALEWEVLDVCAEQTAAFAAREEPDEDDHWARLDWEDERDYGPRYLPSVWFGGGEPLPEKWRTRYLRAVFALVGRGFLETFREGKRLSNVMLTEAGKQALEDRPENA